MNGMLLSEALQNLGRSVTVTANNLAATSGFLITYGAYVIAIGGFVFQALMTWRQGKRHHKEIEEQNEQRRRETIEQLLKQKAEEYYLVAEKALHGFTNVIAELGIRNTKTYQSFLDGQLEDGRTLTMLENYHLVFFKNARHGATKLLGPLSDKFHKHVERIKRWEASSPQIRITMDIDNQWQELKKEYDTVSNKLRRFLWCLSRMDLYKLFLDYVPKSPSQQFKSRI